MTRCDASCWDRRTRCQRTCTSRGRHLRSKCSNEKVSGLQVGALAVRRQIGRYRSGLRFVKKTGASKQAATNNLEAETMTSLWRRLLVARDRSGDGASTIRARLLCLVLSCRAPTADAIDDCKKNIKICRSQRGIASAETSLRLSF